MRRVVSVTHYLFLALLTASAPAFGAGFGATPVEQFSVPEGFEVELIYEVPGETQGSWVSLTVDPKNRLIACDQYGGLYRIDVSTQPAKIEKLAIEFEGAQGLLCAFGSLYANVNSRGDIAGIWKLTDTNGDDQYDQKEHIVPMNGGSEHGPHALILSQDGKRIITCAGNNTNLPTDIARSRVPKNWDEDHLLGRMPDARGHNANRMGPGGFILSMNPDGKDLELIATGFRNQYDIALNREGELFTYDADMEWDVGTPWYRPTRINHVISGAEFGWRNGTGKWPAYYPDSFGAAVNIGPGSPTGICFGYGTNFPEKYQNALFICDWSYGNIHAVHLDPDGSSYGGSYETFATAAPLPVTDLAVHPDGALYFTIGGRRTQSGLYRIRYTGARNAMATEEDLNPPKRLNRIVQRIRKISPLGSRPGEKNPKAESRQSAKLRKLRQQIEATHLATPSSRTLQLALSNLGHSDRAIRFASRVALEHQPVEQWRSRVGGLDSAQARILGIVALARCGESADRDTAIEVLSNISWDDLSNGEKIDLLRGYGLIAIRLGAIEGEQRAAILAQLGSAFPTNQNEVDRELAQILAHLQDDQATGKIVAEMQTSPSQENQIHYAMTLRGVKTGWTPELRQQYFQWFNDIQSAKGGMSFGGFIENIKKVALELVSEEERTQLASILEAKPVANDPANAEEGKRELVKQWTTDELAELIDNSKRKPNFDQGKAVFAAAQCYKCHRMGVQGGILGPDLTAAGGRFSTKDLIVSMVEPNKEVSDQYGATQFLTDDGRVVIGRVVNMSGTKLRVMTNMLDPSTLTEVNREAIEATRPAQSSMMPSGLLDTFTDEEIADLIAYLRAGGRSDHPIFQKVIAQQ
ncbi:MAG: L-sorbosone dehydrogenase [Rubripirellula sp.]